MAERALNRMVVPPEYYDPGPLYSNFGIRVSCEEAEQRGRDLKRCQPFGSTLCRETFRPLDIQWNKDEGMGAGIGTWKGSGLFFDVSEMAFGPNVVWAWYDGADGKFKCRILAVDVRNRMVVGGGGKTTCAS